METNLLYRSDDWVAPLLPPRKLFSDFPWPGGCSLGCSAPRGMYEWVIARTRYIDDVFARAALAGFAQVLMPGAGFKRLARFGESWPFGLDEPEVRLPLARFDFKLPDLKNPRDLDLFQRLQG